MRPRRPAPRHHAAATLLLLWALVAAGGCGKRGAPLPPVRVLPEPVKELQVRQIGEAVVLSFRAPSARTDGTPLAEGSDLLVLMSAREPVPRSARELVEAPAVSWTIESSRWPAYARGPMLEVPLRLPSIAAALELPGGASSLSGRRLSFAVQVREPGRRPSLPAGVGSLAVCAAPDPPADVEAVPEEAGVRVAWAIPAGGPPREGFRVFRQPRNAQDEPRLLTPSPVSGPPYQDTNFVAGQSVRYVVRSVARGAPQCESADAASPPVAWVDRFPPAAPQGLAAVQEQGAIRLFWRPNREADLRGYHVYRAEGPGGTPRRMTQEPVPATSWTDDTAVPDIVYSYAVTAIDSASNESPESERATEQLEGSR
jgi:hypothetical protein